MNRKFVSAAVAAALVMSSVPAIAGGPPAYVPDTFTTLKQSNAVRVVVAQSEVKSDINSSNLGIILGGGLLGGLIAAAQNSSREKKAELLITPIRDAVLDFDIDALALKSAQQAVKDTSWLSGATITLGKDNSPAGMSALLDKNGTDYTVFVEYIYDISPNFDSVRVVENIFVATKALPVEPGKIFKPEERMKAKHLAYSHQITAAVLLPNSDPKNKEANAAAWAANKGELARKALLQAFAKTVELTPKTLALTESQAKAFNNKAQPKRGFEGLSGRLIEQTGNGYLFWAKQFVSVEMLI